MALLVLPMSTSATPRSPVDSPDAAARAALAANPEIEALEARVEALRARVDGASARPDPIVGVEYSNMPLTTPWPGEHPMSGLQLKAAQKLLAPGKVDARVDEARAQVEAKAAGIARLQNALAGAAAETWIRIALVRQLRGITQAHIDLIQQFMDVVTVNYEVGRAAQHELLQLQTLRDRLRDDLRDLDRQEQVHLSRLNAALHRAPDAAVDSPKEFATADPPDRAALVAATDGHPRLRELSERASAATQGAARALAEQDPDITISAGYRVRRAIEMGDEGEDFLSVGVSMPLPWFWNDERWGSLAAAKRAEARGLEALVRSERDRLRGEVEANVTEALRARQKAETYAIDLVGVAHRALDSAFAAYRVGRANFSELFQAERALLDLERAAIVARAEAALRDARLKTLTGAWVPPAEDSK